MFEICDVSGGKPYAPIAAFYSVDDVWRYIVAEGHRVRNWKSWLLTTIDVYRQCREIDEYVTRQSELGENPQFGDV